MIGPKGGSAWTVATSGSDAGGRKKEGLSERARVSASEGRGTQINDKLCTVDRRKANGAYRVCPRHVIAFPMQSLVHSLGHPV